RVPRRRRSGLRALGRGGGGGRGARGRRSAPLSATQDVLGRGTDRGWGGRSRATVVPPLAKPARQAGGALRGAGLVGAVRILPHASTSGRTCGGPEPRGFVCRAGFASRGTTVARDVARHARVRAATQDVLGRA